VFRFSMNPAYIGITDGIQDAFSYLQVSWKRWLPAVALIAAGTFIIYLILGTVDTRNLYYVDRYTDKLVFYPGAADKLRGYAATLFGVSILGWLGSCVFAATAIAGLRNRPLTLSYLIGRGLLTVAAALLVGVAAVVAIVLVVMVAVVAPGAAVLMVLAAIPFAIYVGIRLTFMSLAIFDGFGPIAGIEESWRLSARSVMRMFGWGLMAGLIGIGISLLASLVSAPFGTTGLAPLAQALAAAITTTGSCLTVFMMAVLYESERARKDPNLYPIAAAPAGPWGGTAGPWGGPVGPYPYAPGPYPGPYGPGAYPAGPYPYAPAPYPTGPAPYPAGPYPAGPAWPNNQAGIPGWVNPNAPAWPGYPPAYPNTPPAWGPPPGAAPAPGPIDAGSAATPDAPPTDPQPPTS
jgi:hypothetical protein